MNCTLTTRQGYAALMLVLLLTLAGCVMPSPSATPDAVAPVTPVAEEAAAAPTAAQVEEPAAQTVAEAAQVTLVVQLDTQRLLVRAVEFTPPISGLAALEASGLPVVTAATSFGPAVCAVAAVGCPADDCFCGGDDFWNYAYWDGAAWAGYPVGASQSSVEQDGALEGWRWGGWDAPALAPDRALAAQAALAYLVTQQQPDGSLGGGGGSVEALMALGANHMNPAGLRPAQGGASLLAFVVENAAVYSQGGPAAAGKLAVALSAVDACWPAGAWTPADYADAGTTLLAADAGPLAWAILGSYALDQDVAPANIDALLALALDEGGWEWAPGWDADTNSTALALMALAAAGVDAGEPAVVAGLAYLAATQTEAGGFGYALEEGGRSAGDANSTAYVLQALLAWGIDPAAEEWRQAEGDPFDFLMTLQNDAGALGWQAAYPDANLLATVQAVPAFLGHAYPLRRVALPACGE